MKDIKLKSFYGICCITLLFFSKILNAQISTENIEEVLVNDGHNHPLDKN